MGRAGALAALVGRVQATMESTRVADTIGDWASEWLQLSCWAVVGQSAPGRFDVIAARGLTPARARGAVRVAREVIQTGRGWSAASVRAALGDGPRGAGLAFPLKGADRVVAALVGLDRAPSGDAPVCDGGLGRLVDVALAPMGYALAAALRVERAEALTVSDDLTELFNARYLRQSLARELKRSHRTGRPLSLIFADLDRFKRINDVHGHLVGSRVLVETAALLRGASRETDVVARYGGDEFAVVLPDTGTDGALVVARRIRRAIGEHAFTVNDAATLRMTVSIGVATAGPDMTPADRLLAAADRAMYWVKARGRDGVHVADNEPAETAVQHEETLR